MPLCDTSRSRIGTVPLEITGSMENQTTLKSGILGKSAAECFSCVQEDIWNGVGFYVIVGSILLFDHHIRTDFNRTISNKFLQIY